MDPVKENMAALVEGLQTQVSWQRLSCGLRLGHVDQMINLLVPCFLFLSFQDVSRNAWGELGH